MNDQTLELFTSTAWGSLPQALTWSGQPAANEQGARKAPPEPMSFVETLGFPRDTDTTLLAQVLAQVHATPPGTRVQRLLSPGMLSRLFSQSAAEASYALAILSIVESPDFLSTLARLRTP